MSKVCYRKNSRSSVNGMLTKAVQLALSSIFFTADETDVYNLAALDSNWPHFLQHANYRVKILLNAIPIATMPTVLSSFPCYTFSSWTLLTKNALQPRLSH